MPVRSWRLLTLISIALVLLVAAVILWSQQPQTPRPITQDVFMEKTSLVGAGSLLVWTAVVDQQSDIHSLNLSTGKLQPLTNSPADEYGPALDPPYLAFFREENKATAIYLYDLRTRKSKLLLPANNPGSGQRKHLALSGHRLVWSESHKGNWDIYLYDIRTGQKQRITTDPAAQIWPAIQGNLIAWQDVRDSPPHPEIYLYDLNTGREERLTHDHAPQRYPVFSGDWLLWQDESKGRNAAQVYAFNLKTRKGGFVSPRRTTHQILPASNGKQALWFEGSTRPDRPLWTIRCCKLPRGRARTLVSGLSHPGIERMALLKGKVCFLEAKQAAKDIYYAVVRP